MIINKALYLKNRFTRRKEIGMEILEDTLEKHEKRKFDLLKTLYKESGYVTTKNLCSICCLDRRTLYQEMKEVETFISDHFENKKVLEFHKICGYRFLGNKKEYKKIRMHLLEKSTSYLLLKELLVSREVGVQKFCSDHFISVSVLNKRIVALKVLLKKIEFNLVKRKGTIALTGEESRIRYFMFSIYWHVYGGVCWPFSSISRDKVKKCVEKGQFIVSKNRIHTEKWMFILATNIDRYNKKFLLKRTCLPPFCKAATKYYEDINLKIAKSYRSFYIADTIEKDFLLLWVQTDVYFYLYKDFCEKTYEVHRRLDTRIHKKNQLLIERMSDGISRLEECDKKIFYATLIANNLKTELFHEMEFNAGECTSLHSTTAFIQMSNQVISSSEYKINDMKKLLQGYSEVLFFLRKPLELSPVITVYVETELSPAFEKKEIDRIECFLGTNFTLSIDSERKQEKYDVCISTWENEGIADNYIFINDRITTEDLIGLEVVLNRIEDEKVKSRKFCVPYNHNLPLFGEQRYSMGC